MRKSPLNRAALFKASGSPAPAADEKFFLISDLESAIAQLPDVIGVRIIAPEGRVDEIHVISGEHIKPKMLVRDIETTLHVKFHVHIDHRCISVVQSKAKSNPQARLILLGVHNALQGQEPALVARLSLGTQELQGTSILADSPSELGASSLAVINAVEQLLEQPGVIKLVRVESIMLDSRELVLTLVQWRGDLANEILVGATLAGDDRLAAAGRATLDAINRKLIRLPIATKP
ncbi:MAG TPA: hypothetical protein VIX58_04750 [Anaerolineae bacterium]